MENATLADKINEHLKNGGTVVASTYGASTQYGPKWAGKFYMRKDGHIYVKRGKREICHLSGGTVWKAYK